jgi:putative flippase GtrA
MEKIPITAIVKKFIKKDKITSEFSRFFLVGLSNTVVDFSVLNLLIFSIGLNDNNFNYIMFKTTSFLSSSANSFFWNKKWTFNKKSKKTKKEIFLFLTVATSGLFLNVLFSTKIFIFMNEYFSFIPKNYTANISALLGLSILIIWDFFGYKYFVFKKIIQKG